MKNIDRMDVVGISMLSTIALLGVCAIAIALITGDKLCVGILLIGIVVVEVLGHIALFIAYRKEIKDIDEEYKRKKDDLCGKGR